MKKIVSSVAGRVVACCVEEGAPVGPGDEAFMAESMKMEIPAESEASGRIARGLVAVGDEVEEGQELALLD